MVVVCCPFPFHNSPSHTVHLSTFPTFICNPFPYLHIYTSPVLVQNIFLLISDDEMSTAVLPPARRLPPIQSRSSKRSRSVVGSSTSSSVGERVPEFQKCAKLPRKLPKLTKPPREVDYSIIEQHAPDICKSGTPLSYVRDALAVRGPLYVSTCFLLRWSGP